MPYCDTVCMNLFLEELSRQYPDDFRNEVFSSLEAVVKRLCDVIRALSKQVIHSITARDWIMSMF